MGNLFDNFYLIIGLVFFIFLLILGVILLVSSKNNVHLLDNREMLNKFAATLNSTDLNAFQTMDEQMQWQFMQEQIRQMNEQQMNDLLYQMNLQQQEIDRLMATGIEFGGFNPDLNLNPGMQMEQQHQMDMMNHMNDNNFGGPGMF